MTVAHFLPQYRNNILNGHSIPDPCCRGRVWARVGHTGPSQSGLNKFGIVSTFTLKSENLVNFISNVYF